MFPPPPKAPLGLFPLNVQLVTVGLPLMLNILPPPTTAALPINVQW